MTLLKEPALHDPARIRIEQHEVRVATALDRAFAGVEPTETGRALAHPSHDVGQRESTA
jgi:hypothetical protein